MSQLQQYMCEHIEEFEELSYKIVWALSDQMTTAFGIDGYGVITCGTTIIQESDYPIINETFNKYIQDKKRALTNRLLATHFCNCFDSSTAHFIRLEIMKHLN